MWLADRINTIFMNEDQFFRGKLFIARFLSPSIPRTMNKGSNMTTIIVLFIIIYFSLTTFSKNLQLQEGVIFQQLQNPFLYKQLLIKPLLTFFPQKKVLLQCQQIGVRLFQIPNQQKLE
ncbi:transmembrane protein, putative (macronuclear) [Tetrahymena thermophila SB210]|uniref:Transmembrane protein, putative n=1 Tax=Tetrahymena thermophila (strain SB210) TaxID=312017 RepID=I7LUU7_TETTS|nr:transmembrane protein, putative [Tetrahymena thermophila SB210]EAR96077.1 transmembrane protein, putative [Tetrahymena thermophila SB210]|eukprot:XP_001016322.1 transmembrane protein, putative [Tetrahymena thermophila SB210]